MKIGIDLDDVLLDCNTSLALFHNSRYGTSYGRKEHTSWHLEEIWGCSRKEALVRLEEWYVSPEHTGSLPVPGALETIAKLAVVHELYVITSRSQDKRELTQAWLDEHFPGKFKGLYLTSHLESGTGSKAEICRELSVSFLIEDSLIHARDVAQSGTNVLLFDCPWNQEEVSGNIVRIFTWEAVLGFIV